VVPVPPANDGAPPVHLSWITDVIPCNLWVVR
jgi:hypothetical protein